ncbi:MAG: acyl-CoA dehydrogenase family protein [Anaerolineaceae bacterium]|nr:acyl-CoA dehydrogenase family protein [Anaerolineaceae bacterium]
MTINFEIPEFLVQQTQMVKWVAESTMRPFARDLDENEHARPDAFVQTMWPILRDQQKATLDKLQRPADEGDGEKKRSRPSTRVLGLMLLVEMLSWGDAGIYLCLPSPALGGAAIEAVGTKEQKIRLLTRFAEGDAPVWGAMAITEPGAGSDNSSIATTAIFDEETNEWVLNGEKIFITSGKLALEESNGLVIVWATVNKEAGRGGIKPFVVEAGSPGVSIGKVEIKHGIRTSDTVTIVLNNARIPADNILGSAEVQASRQDKGFKGAMATFDASRPLVAASALGVGRAALEFVKEKLAEEGVELPYGLPYHQLTAVQRDILEMEAQLKAAYLLTLRSVVMLDAGEHNSLEASMAKAKAGKAVTSITQKAVELLGMMGYSREWLVEKWMRDGKINDIFEGTGQINTLIVARRILDYSRHELA